MESEINAQQTHHSNQSNFAIFRSSSIFFCCSSAVIQGQYAWAFAPVHSVPGPLQDLLSSKQLKFKNKTVAIILQCCWANESLTCSLQVKSTFVQILQANGLGQKALLLHHQHTRKALKNVFKASSAGMLFELDSNSW